MARDRGLTPAVGKLLLIYPALDYHGRNGQAEESNSPLTKHLTWTEKKNQIAWRAYLDGYTGAVDGYDSATEVSQYAAPARETDVSGLPRTYVDIGGLDLFRDEVLAFGARLAAANVELELHLYPGVPHSWEW
jgi:acetyl esterase/lipase